MKTSAKVLTTIIVVGAAYAGLSWYVGQRAQQEVQQFVEQANDRMAKALGTSLGGRPKLAISEYKRHVFSSDVVYTLSMTDADNKRIELLISDHMQHGPFPLEALASGEFAPLLVATRTRLIPSTFTQKWFESVKGRSPIEGETRVGLGGKGSSSWKMLPVDVLENGESFKFSGGSITAGFTRGLRDSETHGVFDSLEYSSAASTERFLLKDIVLDSTVSTAENEAVTVRSTAAASAVEIAAQSALPLKLEKVAISLDSSQINNRIDGALRYDFGAIRVGDSSLGSLAAGVKGQNLNAQALADLTTEYDRIKARHGLSADDDFELSSDEAIILRNKLWTVLDSQPTVSVDPFVWKNEQGQSSLKLAVNLGRPAQTSGDIDVAALIPQVIKRLDFDLSIEKPMFIQAFAQLQGDPDHAKEAGILGAMVFDQYAIRLRQAGLLKPDGDNIVTGLRYEKDRIDLNGRSMTVQEFVQRVLGVVM